MDGFPKNLNIRNHKLKFATLFVLCLVATVFIFYRFPMIADNTMEPTLKKGLRIVVRNQTFLSKPPPSRGQLVAYRDSENIVISRIVGLAGDSIRVIDNFLFINDEKQTKLDHNHQRDQLFKLDDDISQFHLFKESLQPIDHWLLLDLAASSEKRNFPRDGKSLVVPKDSFFVMGDNRNLSIDTSTWKIVSESEIVGVPVNVKN